ncbi:MULTISPECIES: DUF4224 domain-containing protein [unclassified Variovorax]|uniref:DUF4224 domain-containing protein n=1 Tax=unclassified Variovorax TaxID=663243 RepID=UPI002576D366|nr:MULTISPECIES: DUF4224 domain-containing protein [unclassified Variovorax]MDM0090277.1 DUF4224 domain-containing protein [Variovorax sp. J22G40]MDM0148057.1 DUF4224 domain-containing protein [Variovorax sp. J2P1-31]
MSAAALNDEWLSTSEIKTMTGEASPDDQERVLRQDGVPFRRRGKRILVSRFHTREWLSGRTVTPSRGVNFSVVK